MILIEKEDVLRIGLNPIPFYIKWEIGSPEAVAADYDDVIADGPFAGIDAIFQTADAERRAFILLEILAKPVSMQIDAGRLRKAG